MKHMNECDITVHKQQSSLNHMTFFYKSLLKLKIKQIIGIK